MIKTLIWRNSLDRDAFLKEKALKKQLFMRYASRLQHYLALKNEIFSSTLRAFYKNAQIFTTVRLDTLFLGLICFKLIAERFALLK